MRFTRPLLTIVAVLVATSGLAGNPALAGPVPATIHHLAAADQFSPSCPIGLFDANLAIRRVDGAWFDDSEHQKGTLDTKDDWQSSPAATGPSPFAAADPDRLRFTLTAATGRRIPRFLILCRFLC